MLKHLISINVGSARTLRGKGSLETTGIYKLRRQLEAPIDIRSRRYIEGKLRKGATDKREIRS